jgi:hypothetical protein
MLLSKQGNFEEIMIGKEDNEEVVLKVVDRRKFNFDGSAREGFEAEPEPPKVETPVVAEEVVLQAIETPEVIEEPTQFEEAEAEEFPGVEDPASFGNFFMSLASQAAASLGAMPHPVTGQRSIDLETGKHWIDILGMLEEKTKGNLHPQEAELVKSLTSDLRLQYVQVQRIAEERMKQQAAQKFSPQDILGRK